MMNWLISLWKKKDQDSSFLEGENLWDQMTKGCPECGCSPIKLHEGPSGGACINVFCADCGQGYNISPIVQWAQKIRKDTRYIR